MCNCISTIQICANGKCQLAVNPPAVNAVPLPLGKGGGGDDEPKGNSPEMVEKG